MSQFNPSGLQTFTAGAAIGANIRVILTAGKLAIAAAGTTDYGNELGTTEHAVFADGDLCTVRLRNAPGTRKCVALTAFAAGAALYGTAGGKVDDVSSGTQLAIAIEAAGALNDVVEVMYL